jgi:hypothetical protein
MKKDFDTFKELVVYSFNLGIITSLGGVIIALFQYFKYPIGLGLLSFCTFIFCIFGAFVTKTLIPLLSSWIFPQKIKCEFIPIDRTPSPDNNHPYSIRIEKMYAKLNELVKNAKSFEIVDNINSQLDHLTVDSTSARSLFHKTITERLRLQTLKYHRIEVLYNPDRTIDSTDIYATLPNTATKHHIDEVIKHPLGSVQFLSSPIQIGTFIIIDNTNIIFQIDGIDFDNLQVPSDLIILTVSNPNIDLLKSYREKFDVLIQKGRSLKEIKGNARN